VGESKLLRALLLGSCKAGTNGGERCSDWENLCARLPADRPAVPANRNAVARSFTHHKVDSEVVLHLLSLDLFQFALTIGRAGELLSRGLSPRHPIVQTTALALRSCPLYFSVDCQNEERDLAYREQQCDRYFVIGS
jgi:hypothetical protein